jgi:FtsP/CotA-like multicopper oxidase with cupredoxin domain
MTGQAAVLRAMGAKSVVKKTGCAALCAAALFAQAVPGEAQTPPPPCPAPAYANPATEIVSNGGGLLRGTINLTEQFIALPQPGDTNCSPRPSQIVRTFQGYNGVIDPPMPPPNQPPALKPVAPGPTLRAKLGDIVQLSFINQVNQNNFDQNLDLNACTQVVDQSGPVYPLVDVAPNCLHASSTANIHFHGTHTSPKSTADNVYLMIRPLPRDRMGEPTVPVKALTQSFATWFDLCAEVLRRNPLNQWPVSWNDLPAQYAGAQTALLQQYQTNNPTQPIWDANVKAMKDGVWPQYYIGAYPYCFALPEYKSQDWPAPPGSPRMGQSPGTHWYHAHKHGSTAVNVGNGMVGAFIIEGASYDGALTDYYKSYLVDGVPWNSRQAKVMVLNQLNTVPNLLAASPGAAPDFVVNGMRQPQLQMRPGEVQLWRIVNASGRSAAYFQAPKGVKWRQTAQDGVQLDNTPYLASEDKPLYVAPGNRIDLLVQAPTTQTPPNQPVQVRIQSVMARGNVKPIPARPSQGDPDPSKLLLSVVVGGQQVQPQPMPFIPEAPKQPAFLADITNQELTPPSPGTSPMVFNSLPPGSKAQHTINNQQFSDQGTAALINVPLNAVQEWTIANATTNTVGPGLIDHPFHIHINPFQITAVFDPNQKLTDANGVVIGRFNPNTQKTEPIPRYLLPGQAPDPDYGSQQCVLDPNNPDQNPPAACPLPPAGTHLVWWDVFAIPSGRLAPTSTNPNNVIPGYFRMRSRFVDFQGLYVLHCHILIHEDRGMMFRVNTGNDPSVTVLQHH